MTHPRSSRYAQKKICLKSSNTNLTKNPFVKYLGDFLFVNANVMDDGVCVVRCSVHLPLPASWLIYLSTAVSANYQLLLCVIYSSFLRLIVNNVAYFSLNFAVYYTNIGTLMFEWSNHGQYEASDVSVFFFLKKTLYVMRNYLIFSYRAKL